MNQKRPLSGALGVVAWIVVIAIFLLIAVHFHWAAGGGCNWDGCGPND
jgi:hypothetical protein